MQQDYILTNQSNCVELKFYCCYQDYLGPQIDSIKFFDVSTVL